MNTTLASSVEVKKRIEENIQIGTDNLASKNLNGVFALLKSIEESKDKPAALLARFQKEVIPVVAQAAGVSGYSESHGYLTSGKADNSELFDTAALVLRNISLAAWNDYDDKMTAVTANKLAIQHAVNAELKQRLLEDRATLQKNATHHLDDWGSQLRNNAEKSSKFNPGLVALAIIGLLVLWGIFGSSNPTNDSEPGRTYDSRVSGAPANSPTPTSDTVGSEKNVYRVPDNVSSELDREKAGIEVDRIVVKQLDDQVESLGREVENDRINLDKTSQNSVDEFNAKVDRYNTLVQKDKDATSAFNQRVDGYNAKLQQYGH